MDDYSLVSLSDSKNEWCARLVNTLSPCVIEGLKSIFDEAWKLCIENNEEDKYLMTFQTFLSRIPKWNPDIIQTEKKRIEETSMCKYLEELITCVHVIQLKALTCARVGHKQKKVNIDIPSVDTFIHRVYCNVARKLYTSVYLFEKDIMPLEIQKHNRELEVIIKECILNTVRDTMPIEKILQLYLDETEELDVNEEIVIVNENVNPTETDVGSAKPSIVEPMSVSNAPVVDPAPKVLAEAPKVLDQTPKVVDPAPKVVDQVPEVLAQPPVPVIPSPVMNSKIETEKKDMVNFNDMDNRVDINGNIDNVLAPKTDERLEKISELSAERRRREEEEEEEEDKIKIGDAINLSITDINDLNRNVGISNAPILDDIEVLT